jgi:two-component system nitrate/nitrite response regulator NarL
LRVAGSVSGAADALEILEREAVDLILLDYDLGAEQGLAFLDELKQRKIGGRVLIVTAGISDQVTLDVLESGVAGIFFKHSAPEQLLEAIRSVMTGKVWMDPKTMRSLITTAGGRIDSELRASLTVRERAVLKATFQGLTNKEIAARLQTTEGSVKAALQQLFDKTGVRTRSQLVRFVFEKRAQDWLLDDGDPDVNR